MITHSVFPVVLLTGFFTAGTNAGISCNTFPWVGEHWFYTKNHFFVSDEIPFWRNFTENKLICQVNHRTLATLMTLWTTFVGIGMIKLINISFSSKTSIILLILSLWTQMSIGISAIWNSVPIHIASAHQIGAMTVMTTFLYTLHNARRVDIRHVNNMIGKLKREDPNAYKRLMTYQ